MATVTVRNLDDEVQRLLKERAAQHNRSMEAEAREILTAAVRPRDFTHAWLALARELGGDEVPFPERSQPRTISFE